MQTADEQSQGRIFDAVVWTLSGFVVLAILAGVVILVEPFRGYRRSPQTEVKANLKAVFTAQKGYYQERDTFNDDASVIGFGPERGNRYNYFLAPAGRIERRDKATAPQVPAQIIGVDKFKYGEVSPVFARWSAARCPTPAGGPGDPREPRVTKEAFLITAVGNIDNDDTLDCWSIASYSRVGPRGQGIPAGEPLNDQNDLVDN